MLTNTHSYGRFKIRYQIAFMMTRVWFGRQRIDRRRFLQLWDSFAGDVHMQETH